MIRKVYGVVTFGVSISEFVQEGKHTLKRQSHETQKSSIQDRLLFRVLRVFPGTKKQVLRR